MLVQQVDRKSANFSCDGGAIERNRQIGLDIARLRPAVVTRAVEGDGVERLVADHRRHRVGELDFAAGALFLAFEHPHDFGLKDVAARDDQVRRRGRSEEHTSELQSLMRNSYAVLCLKKKTNISNETQPT